MRLQSKFILIILAVSLTPLLVENVITYYAIPDAAGRTAMLDSLLLFSFISTTIMVALAIVIARTISKPVRILSALSGEIAHGNFEVKIPTIHSHDEVAELGRSFAEMTTKLKASYADLEAQKKELDSSNQQLKASNQQLRASNQQLDATTQQLRAANQQLTATEKGLKEKIEELEVFNKVTVGREIKMVELKKEIETLKSKKA